MPNVLVFESDSKFAGELKGELERRGCAVTVVDDAAVGLQTASVDKPDLIILTIELPRMNGFSVCNKLKRDPALKEVPLIIMSSDSTEETFEQHRRLRTHAEDYVHKPIAFVDLLPRISAQMPLGGSAPAAAPDDDIVIDDDVAFESIPPAAEAAPSKVDDEVDAFTESAFGNIVEEPAAPPAEAAPAPSPEPPAVSEAPVAVSEPPLDIDAAELMPASIPAAAPEPPPAEKAASVPPRPRMESIDQAIRDENVKLAERVQQLDKEVREARARNAELEDQAQRGAAKDAEVQRLQRELDETKAKVAGSGPPKGAGSARDFLDLREALNKKDKEILDLRDQITHKEKELLGLRDTNLSAEREKADLLDRSSELERQTGELARQLDGARADKEQASKRADDFKRKSEKLQADLDTKVKEAADFKQKLDEEMALRAAREATFETELREAGERAEQVRAVAVAAAEDRAYERGRTEAHAETEQRLADAALASTREKEDAILARESELLREHDAKLEARDRAHGEALAHVKAEHAQLLAEEERAALHRIQEIEAKLKMEHDQALSREVSAHASTKSDLVDTTARLHFIEERISGLEGDLALKTSELLQAQASLSERDGALSETSGKLASVEQMLATMGANLAIERSRAEKAQAKWTEDKASLERAKDALAAALAQMDEIEGRGLD